MCGIAGFYLPEGNASAQTLRRMCDAIRHRGPDDEGYHLEGGCGLGMRRLSIIDLETGRQPIANEDGTIWVVFNGEIYNYRELRASLEAHGHRFRTQSDTETLAHLYEQEGIDGIARLRGMFAFALWDARQRRLLLVRDRFGKKPLYYAEVGGGLYFSSEMKSLRGLPFPFTLDEEALRLYFLFGYVPDPYTPFRAIRKLEPGSWLRFDAQGRLVCGRYWKVPVPVEEADPQLRRDAACDELRRLFDESVRIRMQADVPLGAFLSGGIDSASVVASMAAQSTEPVKTFSIGFEEPAFDELRWARLAAERYGTEHHEMVVRPDSIAVVEKLASHFDEPFGDSSAIPTYMVSRFAAEHVKVVLSGDGGDELFAGYDSFRRIDRLRWLDRVPLMARRAMGAVAEALPYEAYGKNYLRVISRASPLERYFELTYAPYFLREQLLESRWMLPAEAAYFQRAFACYLAPEEADVLTQALYFEAAHKLPGDMLVKVDRMSMAASLEVRCPLLDHVLAEYAARLPHAWKMVNGTGKAIFVEAVGDRLPPELLRRPKMGFAAPIAVWFRGVLQGYLRDHLLGEGFLGRGIARRRFVEQLIEEHVRGRRSNEMWLFRLLMLELWFRQWAGELAESPVASP